MGRVRHEAIAARVYDCDIPDDWLNDLEAGDPSLKAAVAAFHQARSYLAAETEHEFVRGIAGPLQAVVGACIVAAVVNVERELLVTEDKATLGHSGQRKVKPDFACHP